MSLTSLSSGTNWLISENLRAMISDVERVGSFGKKLDLFCIACCRRIDSRLLKSGYLHSLQVLEQPDLDRTENRLVQQTLADAATAPQAFRKVTTTFGFAKWYAAEAVRQAVQSEASGTVVCCARAVSYAKSMRARGVTATSEPYCEPDPDEGRIQRQLLRCIVGNPFRPVTFDPAWRSETAVTLASIIYAERAFDRLPILADALEEAGCDNTDVLAHCRGPGPHARGCWVVDGVLGKG